MKLTVDTEKETLVADGKEVPFYSDEGFRLLSSLWLKTGWNQKYTYTFTWFGVPIIQLPDDMIRYQEIVFRLKPDVIIETGIAHGGSAVFSASLLQLIGKGRVIAIDVDIRPHNRKRLEEHPLKPRITLIEGSSVAPDVVAQVKSMIRSGERVMVILDSNHSYAHVAEELEAYAPLVSVGSYIVATDGFMKDVAGAPRGKLEWCQDNPSRAAIDFAARNPYFVIKEPEWLFNESTLEGNVTHWPNAWLLRTR
ncbi:MAG: Cephalosporin hydroxylase [Pseudolabrys sp.]|jgi:cephalosporin hydroxylase|nr:Cephalosporin hydroxylase [Pseudolabrys sp.]